MQDGIEHPTEQRGDEPMRLAGNLTRRRALQVAGTAVGALALEASAASARTDASVGAADRFEASFDEDWLFYRGDASGADAPAFDDSAWSKLDLPHDWSIEDLPDATSDDGGATAYPSLLTVRPNPPEPSVPLVIGPFDPKESAGGGATAYTVGGVGWYRKHFAVPRGDQRFVELRFDGIYQNADVWLNGVHLGFHPYGYTSFAFDLTPYLDRSGANVVAVRVDNSGQTSRWYSGSGIDRHTWLTVTGPVRIPLWGVYVTTPAVSRAQSVAHVQVQATNLGATSGMAEVRVSVLDGDGRPVASGFAQAQALPPGATNTYAAEVAIRRPALWSPDSPTLYQAKADLLVGGQVVDSVTAAFGVRSLEWDGNGFLLNGKRFEARGANTHSTHGPLGAAALGRAEEREIELLKAAGFNALRTAHNPVPPAKLDACDRLGMIVWNEFTDMWDAAKKPDDYHLYFPAWWQRDLTSFVLRDRNHPSVVVWSLGNEIDDTTGGVRGKEMYDLVHSLDASRPVTQGAPPFATLDEPMYKYVDVADFHYDNPAMGPGIVASAASLHAAFPNKAVTKSESWALTMYDDWQLTQANDWFVGSWVWTGMDYLGESGLGAPIVASSDANLPVFGNGNYPWFVGFSGDLDLIGQRKPQNHWRAVVYGFSPLEMMVEQPTPAGTQQFANLWQYYDELESWNWEVPAGHAMKVRVYTAGDSVTLLLNGVEVAANTLSPSDKLVTTFSVPYAPGELTAVARRSGSVIARRTLTTTGTPAAIRLTSDTDVLTTGRDDLAHVLVEIVDSQGRRVPDAVTLVSFQVAGAGELAAAGSGNPQNVDSFRRPRHHTWHGQALAILRPAKTRGRLTLVATAPGLRPSLLALPVKDSPPPSDRRVALHSLQHPGRRWVRASLSSAGAWPLLAAGAGAALLRRRDRQATDRAATPETMTPTAELDQ